MLLLATVDWARVDEQLLAASLIVDRSTSKMQTTARVTDCLLSGLFWWAWDARVDYTSVATVRQGGPHRH